MTHQERAQLIAAIEDRRNSAVLCYVTGDRENINTRIAPDVIRVFFRHLEALDSPPNQLDLFLYTRGGDVLTPWRIVNLFREYSSRFAVLVPFRAYSAGTMICLGADEIVMGKMAELGPIDPSVANAFNPQDPTNPRAKIPVSVEDVFSYLTLAREKGGIAAEAMVEVFSYLSERVHPLALGNVHRNYSLIRLMAYKLLRQRNFGATEEDLREVVDGLTEKLYAHNYMIPREEAIRDLKLPVLKPDPELEKLIWELYQSFERELHLLEPFEPLQMLENKQEVDFESWGGIIESRKRLDAFIFSGQISSTMKTPDGGIPNVNVNITKQVWRNLI